VLESGWGIGKAHRHDEEFKGAIASAESGLPLFSVGYADIVVSVAEIDLGEVLGAADAIEKVIYTREWIAILGSDVVKGAVVHTKAEAAVFLLSE
jgi:hypothetical protein